MINCSSFLSASIQNHTKKQTGCGFSTSFLTRARSRFILGITAIIVCASIIPSPTVAQTPNWMGGTGALCDPLSSVAYYLGRVGIRTATPLVPLHIHSGYCLTGDSTIYPAIERLQTQSNFSTYNFGQSAIQFWSGGLGTGQDWAVSAIKPVSNASPLIFNTGDTTSPDNWLGGLAFYCSALGQRPTGGEIEVMRIVDEKVGIRTPTPLGALDVNVGTYQSNLPKISFTSGTTSADAAPGPQIRLYSPYGNTGSPADRESSYSWYIQSLRQYNPMCFLGVNGTSDGTSIATTMGALHFRAGYNTLEQDSVENHSHDAGDIYRDEIGKESTIARMSLLSNGNLGLNNEVPMARFQVTNGAVLFDGDTATTPLKRVVTWINDSTNIVTASEIGAGTRLMWIPDKVAFRAGKIGGRFGFASTSASDTGEIHQYWNTSNIGLASSAIGWNCLASSGGSIAGGIECSINSANNSAIYDEVGHASVALGHDIIISGSDCFGSGYRNRLFGSYGVAIGHNLIAYSNHCIALGQDITLGDSSTVGDTNYKEELAGSIALGLYLKSTAEHNITLGRGNASNGPFINSIGNSLMVGFKSTLPTLFVSENDELNGVNHRSNGIGKVGIGTTASANRLDVNGAVSIGFGANPNVLSDTTSLSVKSKIGIGTDSPKEALSVIGGQVIIWNIDTQAISNSTVDLAVRQKVIIGGTGVLTVDSSNSNNTGHLATNVLLHVHGDAMKLEGGGTWRTASDARYKKDIEPFTDGLEKLKVISPVTFRFNGKFGVGQGSTNKEIGVIAQDIQKELPYMVSEDSISRTITVKSEKKYQIDAVDTQTKQVYDYTAMDEHGHYPYKDTVISKSVKRWVVEPAEFKEISAPIMSYNPNALFYILVNACKELDSLAKIQEREFDTKILLNQRTNDSLRLLQQEVFDSKFNEYRTTNDSLNLLVKNLEGRIARLETEKQIPLDGEQDIILEQNNPNPFADNTTITYYIPDKVQGEAELVITPITQSPALQTLPLSKGTPTQLIISAKDLYTGVFVYSITINGKVVVSKKFIIIK